MVTVHGTPFSSPRRNSNNVVPDDEMLKRIFGPRTEELIEGIKRNI
jgi:hypothetical protein